MAANSLSSASEQIVSSVGAVSGRKPRDVDRLRIASGQSHEITYISACMHDSNESLTAIYTCVQGQATQRRLL